jgi:hypothetical protein
MTNLRREPVGYTRWILPSQPNFLHTHELGIEPLTTYLRGSSLLPLGPIHYWYTKYFFIVQ